jgi:predicted nucleotidyltransferase
MILLPPDFKDFLRLLNAQGVEYLVVGGYAVGYYGHARATADLDVWIAAHPHNASKMVHVLRDFGFDSEALSAELFLKPDAIIRMGVPPIRIEILTSVSGVIFDECYRDRKSDVIDGVPVQLISLSHLKTNKKAAGRHKDLSDLEFLP